MQPDPSLAELPRPLPTGPWRFHIVGVGGAGMNGIATMLVAMGHQVSGQRSEGSPVLDRLSAASGSRPSSGTTRRILDEADFVAFSSAIKADNVELAEARRRGMPALDPGGRDGGDLR